MSSNTHRPLRLLRNLALLFVLAGVAFAPLASAARSNSATPAASGAALTSAGPDDQRLIILGFDGGDGRTVQELMKAGSLPNLQRLADQGTFGPLNTTSPAESPVSWAALNTGRNPAKTGVPGFVQHHESLDMPKLGHIQTDVKRELADFHETPIPTWESNVYAGVAGVGAFLIFLVVLRFLLGVATPIALLLSLILGGVAGWGGMKLRSWLPESVNVVTNNLTTEPFWETAAKEQGVQSVILAAAQAFDRAPVDGTKVLAGLGVPDAGGNIQSFFLYTTDEFHFAREYNDGKAGTKSGGRKLRVDERDGLITAKAYGPMDFYAAQVLEQQIAALEEQVPNMGYKESLAVQDQISAFKQELVETKKNPLTLPIQIQKNGDSADVTIGNESQTLIEGQLSDWYHLTFEINPLIKVHAITRVKILSMEDPNFTLFMDAVEIDPANPPFFQPVSMPGSFSKELAAQVGPFATIGWACATMPFKDGLIDPITLLQDIERTWESRKEMTFAGLERDDWQLFMSVLSSTDRVQHMMYQYYDEGHPLYDAAAADITTEFFGETIALRDSIPAIYRELDRFIGEVMDKYVGPDDTLILCADHGFQSFRRQVHLNNWLHEKGYLAVKEGFSKGGFLSDYVDWSKTKAYSLGLSMLYLNREGVRPNGIVKPEEEMALMKQIRSDFLATVDPENGQRVGAEAYIFSEIHDGPYLDREADMMMGFDSGYHVSWITGSGALNTAKDANGKRIVGPIIEDNDKNWSGDHTGIAIDLVAGLFFSNRQVEIPEGGVDLLHIAPTALSLMGVAVPSDYDKGPLKFIN